ncbi:MULTISPECIES: GNAT family N-acetyltransferase [Lysinibacillus]|uniref:GNAT family N-acetyltransferase n=1 Tax=Lysinibacillus TaxID=400634 RepID=UPI000E8C92F2|nr:MULTISPECIES: GNAT family N-acetyltransferase [Lysinibacillus]HBJ00337.1 GNAT family N-acetyltransferase [Lysinibacillus sp.]MBD8523221.1 GNAT family N-acetyltransferase [Lysinibacillus fusiformis]MCR8853814.1 GNAT family N-acetyltransferase [Lysinibacillus fusiformis]WKT76224.1 GNAT family N-acetyltransferase [Lysinibacillus fusiformis]WKT79721.1 GNAT family N-acetyltransferase [Lysinibacillus fusiformis]
MTVTLVRHDIKYAEAMHELSSMPQVRDALGLPVGKVEDTIHFIKRECIDEEEGKTVPRVVLNEEGQFIGVTALMFIDQHKNSCHIGSWLGHPFWGKGYNLEAKTAILDIAFFELGLKRVFAGARKVNIRSQKAQEKLSFIRLGVEEDYPEEHSWLEAKEKQPCVLNVFEREDFVQYRTSLKKVNESRESFLPQLLLADESEEAILKYLNEGTLFEVKCGEQLAGVALLIPQSKTTIELKNIAIVPKFQAKGLGKEVLRQLTAFCQKEGYQTLLVGTANSSIDNIAFYQKAGFRMESIEKDFFRDYPEPIYENGIRALDMIFFTKQL